MSDTAARLFERFLPERADGASPDPARLIAAAGDQADALSGMIAAYLATTPRDDVPAADVIEIAARPELEPPRPWPQLLPDLRARRATTRTQLVHRLAQALGVTGSERQVAGYVHELEAGLLAPSRVRPAVVTALAAILAVPAGLLETSQRLSVVPPAGGDGAPAFAREAAVDASHVMALMADELPPDPRVDDLFTGGGNG